jgi:DNA polymerase V
MQQPVAAAEPTFCPLAFRFWPKVSAGPATAFSPAEDYKEGVLDISTHLIKHPAASYWFTVEGECMEGAGIKDDDLILIDNSITPFNGAIVVAKLHGKYLLKRYRKKGNRHWLEPDPVDAVPMIEFDDSVELEIFGVMTAVIRKYL